MKKMLNFKKNSLQVSIALSVLAVSYGCASSEVPSVDVVNYSGTSYQPVKATEIEKLYSLPTIRAWKVRQLAGKGSRLSEAETERLVGTMLQGLGFKRIGTLSIISRYDSPLQASIEARNRGANLFWNYRTEEKEVAARSGGRLPYDASGNLVSGGAWYEGREGGTRYTHYVALFKCMDVNGCGKFSDNRSEQACQIRRLDNPDLARCS